MKKTKAKRDTKGGQPRETPRELDAAALDTVQAILVRAYGPRHHLTQECRANLAAL